MKQKLFPNIKPLTTIFTITILFLMVGLLTLRLTAFSGFVEGSAIGEAGNELAISDAMVEYSINREIIFSSPTASAEFAISNPAGSEYDIRVTITRNDNGNSIFSSGALRPGSSIKSSKLQGTPLPDGTYECTAKITTYEVGTSNEVDSAKIPVIIQIGEKQPADK